MVRRQDDAISHHSSDVDTILRTPVAVINFNAGSKNRRSNTCRPPLASMVLVTILI